MNTATLDKSVIFVLRVLVGWVFLYAGTWQIWENYSAAGFLNHVVTFHSFFVNFATPAVLPATDFLMKWGHLLIGLSLVSGLMVRVSGPFGALLMIVYYFAHIQWPFVGDHLNFLVDFHLVYATVIVYLVAHDAGHVWGLDGLVERLHVVERHPALRPLFG
ncbi:MAG: DoxX family protein [Alphaproteobacteria bacterium]|nr:DoxX family protein [Alphaproteobacteria bacterium]